MLTIPLRSKSGQQVLIWNATSMQVLQTLCQKRSHIHRWCQEQFWWTSKVNQRGWVSLSVYNPLCFYLNSTSHNYSRQLIHYCCVLAFTSYLLPSFNFLPGCRCCKRYRNVRWYKTPRLDINQSRQILAYQLIFFATYKNQVNLWRGSVFLV